MNRVRLGWLHYHITGKRPKLLGTKDATPTRTQLKNAFVNSGKAVGDFLVNALEGKGAPRAFGKQAVRWMGLPHFSRITPSRTNDAGPQAERDEASGEDRSRGSLGKVDVGKVTASFT